VLGYVAVQHPTPGVGVLFMACTHWSRVMLAPVAAKDTDAEVVRRRPTARTIANSCPLDLEPMFTL
jgi:hypothetical protein